MLQLDTRPWTPSAFHADRGVSEFSLSTLQTSVFSRSARNTTNTETGSSSSMIENVSRSHDCSPASSGGGGASSISVNQDQSCANQSEDPNNSSTHQKLPSEGNGETKEQGQLVAGPRPAADSNSLGEETAGGGREGGREQLNISRTPEIGAAAASSTAKPPQPEAIGNDNIAAISAGSFNGVGASIIKPTLSLPPIRLAHPFEDRASSSTIVSSSSASSSSGGTSLLPSASTALIEPQLPAVHGRASSSSATDNTSTRTRISSSQSNAPSHKSSPLHSSTSAISGDLTPRSASLPQASATTKSDRAAILATEILSSDLVDRQLPSLSEASIPVGSIDDARSSKKRSLDEYQGNLDKPFPSIANHPEQSVVTETSSRPLSVSPTKYPGPEKPSLTITLSSPSGDVQEIAVTNQIGKRILAHDPDIDTSVESKIILAHRAVIAVKNQSLPRSKTIGPTFTIGKPGSHPFGITRKLNDGVMEFEGDSDTESTTTSSSHTPRMMPWDKRRPPKDETPPLTDPFVDIIDDAPIAGPKPLAASTPPNYNIRPNIFPVVNLLANYQHPEIAHLAHFETPHEPSDSSENGEQRNENAGDNPSTGGENVQAPTSNNESSTKSGSRIVSPIGRSDGGSGGGGEDPNKRSRKLGEHEEDNGSELDDRARAKRRRVDQVEGEFKPEPHDTDDRGAAVSGLFNLSKGHSPPPQLSGPPTVESITTIATIDSSHPYSEQTTTPLTMSATSEVRSDYHKSPVENTPTNTLPPIHAGVQFSPGRTSISPRTTHTPLPGVNSLLGGAPSTDMKSPMDHQPNHPNHIQSSGKISRPRIISHVNVGGPSVQSQTPSPRDYADNYTRPIPYVNPAQQYRSVTPKSQVSPIRSPVEVRNAPIAPAPPNFSAQASTSPLSQYTQVPSYYPPRNTGRPEHRTTLPPLQTDWSSSLPPSEPNSAKTPTSKSSKRGRNGTPKHGSTDSTQDSPSVAGGFKCTEPNCTAPPFSTQYLLNSHANVHSEDRPHFCPVGGCSRGEGGKGFKRKNEMIRHGLVHKSPGYVCPFCPDKEHRYPRPDNLQRHVKAHHKDKNSDDLLLREVLAVRPEGGQRGRRRRGGGPSI